MAVGLSAQPIYQDLVSEHAFTGSYQAVKRLVRHLREIQPIFFVRMELEAGAEAQVDFGQGAWGVVDGKRKPPHDFRAVVSHSRKGYIGTERTWLALMQRGFDSHHPLQPSLIFFGAKADKCKLVCNFRLHCQRGR